MTLRLLNGPQSVKLEPKAMAVLLCLAAKPGEVITRETLMAEVWPETMVGEEALNNAVSKLRRTFGDNTRAPRFIKTVPKVGYCLIAPVRREQEPTHGKTATTGRRLHLVLATAMGALLIGAMAWVMRPPVPEAAQAALSNAAPLWVTTHPGTERNAALDRQGQRLVYAWNGPDRNNYDIYLSDLQGTPPKRLTHHAAYEDSPEFSPDGRSVVFQRFDGADHALFTVPVEGGEPRRLAECTFSIYPDVTFSPDGRLLAFSGRVSENERFGLMILAMDSLIQRKITEPQGTLWGDHDPAFSPDGLNIVYVRSISEGIQDLYITDTEGDGERRLTQDARNIHGVTWLNGRKVVYATNRAGVAALWQLDIDSLVVTPFSVRFWQVSKPTVSADGKVLAFQQSSEDTNIWQWRRHGDEPPQPLIQSTRWDLHPSIAPDGEEMAFTSNRSGSFEIWTHSLRDGQARRLTHFGGPFTGTPRFAPDGLRLAFDSRPNGQADIYVIPRTGGPSTQLTNHPDDDLAPYWSRDGQWLYFASARSGIWQVWKISSTGGEPEQVTQRGGYAAKEGPDGVLYFTRFEEPGIWRLSDDGSEPHQVCADLAQVDWGSWEVREAGLFSIRRKGGQTELLLRSLTGGEAQVLRTLPWSLPTRDPALAVSPDGAQLFFGRVDRAEADILAVRLKPEL